MFNSKAIKKMKKHGMEEMEPKEKYETSEELESYSPKSSLSDMAKIKTKSVPMNIEGLKTSAMIPSAFEGAKKVPSSEIGTIKTMSEYGKKPKGESSLKLDALIAAAAKKKLPVKASVEKEVEISPKKEIKDSEMKKPMASKPTEFVPHGGSYLQYLKAKKK
jgi:hypothetical protein